MHQNLHLAKDYIKAKIGNFEPEIGIILGTGLGKLVDDIEICDNGFGLSNYECIVINGDLSSNNVMFKTDIINDSPSYRIMIYDKHVKLNIIGSMIKTYEIVINSDKQIEFKNIDLKYVF